MAATCLGDNWSRAEPLRSFEDLAVLYFCASVGTSLHQRVASERRKMTVIAPVSYALPTRVEAFVYNNAYRDTPTKSRWPTTCLQE